MNCLDFQRRLNADPYRLGAEAEAHAEACPACARRLAGQMRQEAELARSLWVTPPDGLADRVLLAARMRRRGERGRLYALAASLFLVVGIGLSLAPWREADLTAESIRHVLAEPQFLAAREPVSPGEVAAQFQRVGARLAEPLAAVHAAPCDVPGGEGAHIVLDTPHGRVTVLLMPNRQARAEAREQAQGLIAAIHAAKRGCYALVAPNPRALEHARALLEKRLRWT